MSDQKKNVWVICATCNHGYRDHRILHEETRDIGDYDDSHAHTREFHRFVECMGCKSLKYAFSTVDLHPRDWDEAQETNFKIYPDAPATQKRKPTVSNDDSTEEKVAPLIPEHVWKMYRETIDALNGSIRTLAGGGLRAVVEAICLDKKIKKGNLQEKIEDLAPNGFFGQFH